MHIEEYKLVWEDDFNYVGEPDSSKWKFDIGDKWYNRELQAYTDHESNVYVRDGKLVIRAIKERYGEGEYTSARITTKGKASWKYGYFEFKAKIPRGIGSWPAIWMLPDLDKITEEERIRFSLLPEDMGWPNFGEIDIMEHVGRKENNLLFSLHCKNHNHADKSTIPYTRSVDFKENLWADYHIYGLEWTEDYIEYFVDGKSYCRYNKEDDVVEKEHDSWPFCKPYYLIMNIAVGGGLGGPVNDEDLPFEMFIDYVRVYQKK